MPPKDKEEHQLSYDGLAEHLEQSAAKLKALAAQVRRLPTHGHVPVAALYEFLEGWDPIGRVQSKRWFALRDLAQRYEVDGVTLCPQCTQLVQPDAGPLCERCTALVSPE